MYLWRLYYELHSTNNNYRDTYVYFCRCPYRKPITIIPVEPMALFAILAALTASAYGAYALTPKIK